MIYTDTVTQDILLRFKDGLIMGAMVTEQDLFIDAEDESVVGRSALKIRDMDPMALQELAKYLETQVLSKDTDPLSKVIKTTSKTALAPEKQVSEPLYVSAK